MTDPLNFQWPQTISGMQCGGYDRVSESINKWFKRRRNIEGHLYPFFVASSVFREKNI